MEEEIKKLLKKNIELSKENNEMTKSIKKFVFWSRIFTVVKIVIILIPLILGIIYLPPLVKDVYKEVINKYNSIWNPAPEEEPSRKNLDWKKLENEFSPQQVEKIKQILTQ